MHTRGVSGAKHAYAARGGRAIIRAGTAARPRTMGTPMTLISRRQTLLLGGAAALPLAGLGEAFGQGAGDPVRKINLYSGRRRRCRRSTRRRS